MAFSVSCKALFNCLCVTVSLAQKSAGEAGARDRRIEELSRRDRLCG